MSTCGDCRGYIDEDGHCITCNNQKVQAIITTLRTCQKLMVGKFIGSAALHRQIDQHIKTLESALDE